LLEINRILKIGGIACITGTNANYLFDDKLAYTAEKNAFLKHFPKKFTDLELLLKNLTNLGYKEITLHTFQMRGDFGKYNGEGFGESLTTNSYEYILIFQKNSPIDPDMKILPISKVHSTTAERISKDRGFMSVGDFFESIGLD